MPAKKDYYDILGVEREAPADDVKKAYRQMARQFHPDLNPDPGASNRMRDINEAYEVLSDPDKRARYDQFGTAEEIPSGFGGFQGGFGGINDIFESFFGSVFGQQAGAREYGPVRGQDLRAPVRISLKEVALGVEKEISVNRVEHCSTCQGNGAEPGTTASTCSRCNGRGVIRQVNQSLFGQFVQEISCPECRGQGSIIRTPCSVCRGTGLQRSTRQISLGGPSGDLFVNILVENDPRYERAGADLLTTVWVPYPTLVLGGTVEVESVLEKHPLHIPAGTPADHRMTIRSAGLPYLGRSAKGDLIVQLKVVIPKKVSGEIRALLEQLQISDAGGGIAATKGKKGRKGLFG
ncbi:MAG: DnaJ domain-containing protein [Coprothermobacterota bacterium]|nr:DnaJ domain-containing protein [Coprothermobacterota bacterium]